MTTATSVLRKLGPQAAPLVSPTTDATAVRLLQALSGAIGGLALLVGVFVLLAGWGPAILAGRAPMPGVTAMKVNTAIGIAALGLALLLSRSSPWQRTASQVAAIGALLLGLATLAEYAFTWRPGLDEWLVADPDLARTGFPGRPAMVTCVMLVVLGAALLARHHRALQVAKTAGAIAVALLAWSALTGNLFGREALNAVPLFRPVAPLTAAAMLLLSVGVLAAEPVSRPAALVAARDIGGTICRWLLLPALFAPALFGWLLHRESLVGAWPEPVRWALYSVISSLGSVGLIVLLAHRIRQIDAERSAATVASLRDPLTGLANRRAFDVFLLESLNLSRRHGQALSLLLIDIDWFKTYNDEYGHPAGDELLKGLAGLLSSAARETDLVARIGGEEFAVVLPQTDAEGARRIAERIRGEIGDCGLFRRRVTVSIGIAALGAEVSSTASLLRECDAALYRAKAAGRDRIAGAAVEAPG